MFPGFVPQAPKISEDTKAEVEEVEEVQDEDLPYWNRKQREEDNK